MSETNSASLNSNGSGGVEVGLLEKRLEGLRDTQESVQGLSLWCQANKKHSTPIIDTWLRVLRRSPVEKRLTMFYLANDVVQHAKRKGDLTVVNQWAVAVQKATPHVRTPSSVSTAIIRIFKIWEERNVYSKDTVADLIALVSKHNHAAKERTPETKKKPEVYTATDEKVKAFQASALANTIKQAYRLKSHLGVTFRTKQYVNMNMEQLIASIKDRQHGMSVIESITELLDACRVSENKLVHEVDERRKIVEAAEVAIVFYENVRVEARIVNTAYKNFTERVVKTKLKVDEMLRAFAEMEGSPIPSPDRLSPYDEVQVLLPPIAEFEARQAQASNLIEVQQSSSQSSTSGTTASSQYPNSTDNKSSSTSNMMSGMLPSGNAYDLMTASQWPSYAMQLQMMQAYAYQTQTQSDPTSLLQQQQQAAHQQQQTSQDIGTIPLPPEAMIKPPPQGQQQPPQPQQPMPMQMQPPQHPIPIPPPQLQQQPPPVSTSYDPNNTSVFHNLSSSLVNEDYQSQAPYDPNSYGYDSEYNYTEEPVNEFNSSTPNPITNSGSRYHPYNNSTPTPRARRLPDGTPRPSRFSTNLGGTGTSPGFRNPPPFSPRNANRVPLPPRARFPFQSSAPSQVSPDLPQKTSSITSNLLRLAGGAGRGGRGNGSPNPGFRGGGGRGRARGNSSIRGSYFLL